jgi:hypothetical protein
MQTDETYELTIDMILEQLKDRDISNTEKKRIEDSLKFYHSQKEFYSSSKWLDYVKSMKNIIEFSRQDIDNRMELSETELWTPFTI